MIAVSLPRGMSISTPSNMGREPRKYRRPRILTKGSDGGDECEASVIVFEIVFEFVFDFFVV
jgi:hypothetical protein